MKFGMSILLLVMVASMLIGCHSYGRITEEFEKRPVRAKSVGEGHTTFYYWESKDGSLILQPMPVQVPFPSVDRGGLK